MAKIILRGMLTFFIIPKSSCFFKEEAWLDKPTLEDYNRNAMKYIHAGRKIYRIIFVTVLQ